MEKIERLQNARKVKMNNANNFRKGVEEVISKGGHKDDIKCFFDNFVVLWDEVKVLHNSLMEF